MDIVEFNFRALSDICDICTFECSFFFFFFQVCATLQEVKAKNIPIFIVERVMMEV